MIILRAALLSELSDLSTLCMRSKAYWGYDATFMAACKNELTLLKETLQNHSLKVAEMDGVVVGVAEVQYLGPHADLEKLFIDPSAMGKGAGKRLFQWAAAEARRKGAAYLRIDSDPGAESFYVKMGAHRIGTVASGSIPGRVLPQLKLSLSTLQGWQQWL